MINVKFSSEGRGIKITGETDEIYNDLANIIVGTVETLRINPDNDEATLELLFDCIINATRKELFSNSSVDNLISMLKNKGGNYNDRY